MGDRLQVLSFGCRLNLYESEVMRGLAGQAGLEDVIIVNTCAVTAEAERQGRQAIRRAHRARPDVPVIVTGCAAQLAPESYAAMPEISRVLGNADKLNPTAWTSPERVVLSDFSAIAESAAHLLDGFAENTRGFLEVQQGCDHRCSFCLIPFARGPSRSVPLGQIVAAARHLVGLGHAEIVLTGVDLTAWGADLPGQPRLGQLLRRLLAQIPELPRLRLSSLDPAEIDADLWQLLAKEPRLMPHLHLSVQAGADLILKRMKRRHRRADVLACAEQARNLRPDIVLGADLIAGFPTESDAHFQDTLDLVAEAGLTYLHVFPYSPRPETVAARMPAIAPEIVRARAKALRLAGDAALNRYLTQQIGRTLTVLMERGGIGRSETYALVRPIIPAPAGVICPVRITGISRDGLIGENA